MKKSTAAPLTVQPTLAEQLMTQRTMLAKIKNLEKEMASLKLDNEDMHEHLCYFDGIFEDYIYEMPDSEEEEAEAQERADVMETIVQWSERSRLRAKILA